MCIHTRTHTVLYIAWMMQHPCQIDSLAGSFLDRLRQLLLLLLLLLRLWLLNRGRLAARGSLPRRLTRWLLFGLLLWLLLRLEERVVEHLFDGRLLLLLGHTAATGQRLELLVDFHHLLVMRGRRQHNNY